MATAGCGPVPDAEPGPEPAVRFARPLEVYREMDLMTGDADFPAVASLNTLAGPADSTLVLFGLSLPASVLRFQREGAGFAASYLVALRVEQDSQRVAQVDRRETVRVPDFAETGRTEESVVFQTALVLAPGEYVLSVRVRDALSSRGFQAIDTLSVPAYGSGRETVAPPVTVYRGVPRRERGADPSLVLNPRHTASFGGAPPLVYLEAYGERAVRLEVRDPQGGLVWAWDGAPEPGNGVSGFVVTLPADSLPMGQSWLLASAGETTSRPVPLLVTLSDQWLVSNFEEALELIRYIASDSELEAMAGAEPGGQRALWDAFWSARDPVPATPANEYRDTFFERIRTATVQFGEPGRPGWRTVRGEVYIVLGPPTQAADMEYDMYGTGPARAQEWMYERVTGGGGLRLVFVDRTGFGVYRLTPASESAFRAAAQRVKERVERR